VPLPWDHCGNLTTEVIREKLENNPLFNRPVQAGTLRKAAVLIPLVCERGALSLLFTRRTDTVHDHKGQVAFPGGTVELQDPSMDDTALRETFEEIGIPPEEVCVLGRMPQYPTITGYMITPVVGLIPWPYDLRFSDQEVSRVFTIPLSWLADPENREEKEMTFPDGRRERVVIFCPYQGEKVWGVTARITLSFLKVLELS
jgi:8-oxo-dGTP pyrophosphatase MutT (NUDIX family)